jgi:sterol desaturase/sphingolipid hydroxylase (fatty acid hydroxylase superfamily)
MIRLVVSIISYDIWFYISHVILHSQFMYHFHKLHHTKPIPTYEDTYLAHSVETVFQGVGFMFPAVVYTYMPQDIILVLLFLNIRGMMAHDPRFVFLVGNHHLLHHKYGNCNYGQYWIDSLGGTRHHRTEDYVYGLIYV